MSKVLVDTNILIYVKDNSSIFHQAALKIIDNSDDLYITSKNITEYYSVVTKGAQPLLTSTEALEDIREFISFCQVLYPDYLSYQKLSKLILLHQPKGLLIHDFEIASIGLVNGVNKIATFNKADFSKITELQVINI